MGITPEALKGAPPLPVEKAVCSQAWLQACLPVLPVGAGLIL